MDTSILEEFTQIPKQNVDMIYNELKKHTKKVSKRADLQTHIEAIIEIVSLLQMKLGKSVQMGKKDFSHISAEELRDIHSSMRKCLTNARTRKMKSVKIARMIRIVEHFLQY